MRRAGFDLHNTEATLQMIDNDPATFIELEELLLESIYQLRKTLLEMHRHNSDPGPENQEAIRQWVEDAEHNLENAAGLLL